MFKYGVCYGHLVLLPVGVVMCAWTVEHDEVAFLTSPLLLYEKG